MTEHPDDTFERNGRRLTYESTFESLQNPRRRRTLQYLTERDGPTTVGELADRIAAWEGDIDVDDVAPGARKSVYNSLTQTHLPHLDARGIVEYDRGAGTVELTPDALQLTRYVPPVPTSDGRWSVVVLATVGVASAVAVANWLGVFAPAVPAMALNAVVVGLFLAVSIAYAASTRS